ncbi:MAG: C25 family cysteine peptidase [Rudaea sp.]
MSCGAAACSGQVHVDIKEAGVYALDYSAITAAQPALNDCKADDLYVRNGGGEVPIRIVASADGSLNPSSRIEWLAQARHGPASWYDQYSAVNVYQIGASPGAHARVRAIDSAGAAGAATTLQRMLHIEQENFMLRVSDAEMKPGEEPDVWQWAKLTPIDPKPFSYDFDLPDIDTHAKAVAEFVVNFRGMSNVLPKPEQTKPIDHVVDVSINGKTLPPLKWDGRSEFRQTIAVPLSSLKEKSNTIVIRVPKRDNAGQATDFIIDVVMFNWMEASFPIRADVGDRTTAFRAVRDGSIDIAKDIEIFGADGTVLDARANARAELKSGVDYFAAGPDDFRKPPSLRAVSEKNDARSVTEGYDYLIVAHSTLLDAIEPLAAFHRAHGMKVAVYNVDDLYDQFNDGIVHPRAIRGLVDYALAHWQTKPRYLLLVGDASFDIHHDQRTNRPDKHMYAARVNPPTAEMTQADGFWALGSTSYAQVSKKLPNRNLIPTWQYPTGEGQSASDNEFVSIGPNDFHPRLAVGRFPVVLPEEVTAIVNKTIGYLTSPPAGDWRRDVTFVSTSEVASFKGTSDQIATDLVGRGFVVNNVYTDSQEKDASRYQNARETLKRDLDDGNLLVHFLGHGGQYIWRVGPIGDLFSLDDVSALKNVGRYPMVLAMTCFSAPFDHPTEDSIGERFLREADKGAVAVFAASWSNWPNPENSKALVTALLRPGVPIGDSIVAVKDKTQDPVLVEMYNLLGDPAIVLIQPQASLAFMRTQDRWKPQLLVRIPAPSFGGNVAVDWLDAAGKTISSRNFESRDRQFFLPIIDKAAQARVYATDTRTGFSAFGTASLAAPAVPVKVAALPATPLVKRPPRVRNPADDIVELDFDTAHPPAADAAAAHPAH